MKMLSFWLCRKKSMKNPVSRYASYVNAAAPPPSLITAMRSSHRSSKGASWYSRPSIDRPDPCASTTRPEVLSMIVFMS